MSVTSGLLPRGGPPFPGFGTDGACERRLTRTVMQRDNMLFFNMTLNRTPLPIDTHFAPLKPNGGTAR